MLADSDLNPQIKLRNRVARSISPANRAAYLGNDATGMTQHYATIDRNTFDELRPVVHRTTTWHTLPALNNISHYRTNRLSELVRDNRRSDFWSLYKTLRSLKLSRKKVIQFIRTHGTSE